MRRRPRPPCSPATRAADQPPNYYLLDLATGKRTALTDFTDPAPAAAPASSSEILNYKRADGVPLSGMLYLPPGYKKGTRLPVLVWAYPLEYSDAGTAGQVRGSPNSFVFYRGASPLFFLTQGYAVLMDATMPVVGDPETMNDTFVEQIVGAAKAAIDKLTEMGVADPNRVLVSGHSYGAFMTANLLAHSDLFAAGIARSGAYNRTLTPFGFQTERRSFWEASSVYMNVSPFTHATKIKEPLLLIHGEADNNSGTHTMQSERLLRGDQGRRRHRAAGAAAARGARLPGARIDPARAGRDDRVGRQVREEPQGRQEDQARRRPLIAPPAAVVRPATGADVGGWLRGPAINVSVVRPATDTHDDGRRTRAAGGGNPGDRATCAT